MLAPERRLCHAKLCTLMWRPTTAVWLQPLSLWHLRPCTPGLCSTQCPSQPPLQTVKNDPQRAQRYHSEAERLDAAASQATQNSAITNWCAPWHGSCVNVVVVGSQPAQGTVPLVHSRAWPSRCHALPDINKCCRCNRLRLLSPWGCSKDEDEEEGAGAQDRSAGAMVDDSSDAVVVINDQGLMQFGALTWDM